MSVCPIPEGHSTITPYLVVRDAAAELAFIERAFGATVTFRMNGPDGRIAHAEATIGSSRVMIGQPQDGQPLEAMLHMYVEDCDATFERAVAAGATASRELADQFYGDRSGQVRDPQGILWHIATHKEDVSSEEMERRMQTAQA